MNSQNHFVLRLAFCEHVPGRDLASLLLPVSQEGAWGQEDIHEGHFGGTNKPLQV